LDRPSHLFANPAASDSRVSKTFPDPSEVGYRLDKRKWLTYSTEGNARWSWLPFDQRTIEIRRLGLWLSSNRAGLLDGDEINLCQENLTSPSEQSVSRYLWMGAFGTGADGTAECRSLGLTSGIRKLPETKREIGL
jgi:hypothetical protein